MSACTFCQKVLLLDSSFHRLKEKLGNTRDSKTDFFQHIFHKASETGQIDHPLCEECYRVVHVKHQHSLELLTEEIKEYQCFYEMLCKSDINISLDEEIENLLQEERDLETKLKELDNEHNFQLYKIEAQKLYNNQVKVLEERYWDYCMYTEALAQDVIQDNESIRAEKIRARRQLQILYHQNSLNEMFHIRCGDHFGIINNLRLGTLESCPVEWEEINAAWGNVAMLLFSLSKLLQLKFIWHRVIPAGSFSKMETIEGGQILELFGSSSINTDWKHRYDAAMGAFLQCVSEIGDYVSSLERDQNLPFCIVDGKIDGLYLQRFSVHSENFTLALKKMLVNMKYLLHWSSKYVHQNR